MKYEEPDANFFSFQYFVNFNFKCGWYISSTPTITAEWEADSDDRWTVPIGGGVGRLVKFGKQPMDLKAQAFWNAERPSGAADWSLQLLRKIVCYTIIAFFFVTLFMIPGVGRAGGLYINEFGTPSMGVAGAGAHFRPVEKWLLQLGEEKEKELKKEQELAIRIMNALCEEAKADCKLVEK